MLPSLYEIGHLVNFKEGDSALYRTPLPLFGGLDDIYHIVSEGDTIELLAEKYYNDQFLWYLIADANPDTIQDIFQLEFNTSILIPNLDIVSLLYG